MNVELREFMEIAQQCISLAKKMDEAFEGDYDKEHLELAICAGLLDTYKMGIERTSSNITS